MTTTYFGDMSYGRVPSTKYGQDQEDTATEKASCTTMHVTNDSELFNPMFFTMDNFCIMDDEFSGSESDGELSDDDIVQCRPKSFANVFKYDMESYNSSSGAPTTGYLSTEPLDGEQFWRVSPLPSPFSPVSPTCEPKTPPKCRSWTGPTEHIRLLTSIEESEEDNERRLSCSEGTTGKRLSLASLDGPDGTGGAKSVDVHNALHVRRASQVSVQKTHQCQHSFTVEKLAGANVCCKLDDKTAGLCRYVEKYARGAPFAGSRYRSLTF